MRTSYESNMYKSVITIGNEQKTIVVINHKEGQKLESKVVDKLHHIHILDRSGSMCNDIDNLIEDVKKTIGMIDDNDYLSVVWFSGPGQYKTIIKGAQKNDTAGLYKLLDSIKSTIGCTCFSDPLKEAGEIINDLRAMCENFSVTLFTDGLPVIPWSDEEEYRRIGSAVADWNDNAIALNTVGYGNYYNQDMLKYMSDLTDFGTMIHSRNINEYSSIFSHNFEKIRDMVLETVEVSAKDVDIMYLNPRAVRMYREYMKLKTLDKRKNQIILIGDGSFDFEYGGIVNTDEITREIPKSTMTPLLYALASMSYYQGNRVQALDILGKLLKDKALVDSHFTSFTFDECAIQQAKLNDATFHIRSRLVDGQCPDDYIPADDALCVLDILNKLMEIDGIKYLYKSDYKRIGLQQFDDFNLFERDAGLIATDFNKAVYNKEKLNISIQSTILGKVQINPKQAKKVGLPSIIDSRIYRNQTIIKDGFLNMRDITIYVPAGSLAEFYEWVLQKNVTINLGTEKYNGEDTFIIQLEDYPILNRKYAGTGGSASVLLGLTLDAIKLEARQKSANFVLKHKDDAECGHFSQFSKEQVEVLKEHGLNSRLEYEGVSRKTAEKEEGDFYESRELKFQIKGNASLPTVDKALEQATKGGKISIVAKEIADWVYEMNRKLHGVGSYELSITDKEIKYANNELRAIKEQLNDTRAKSFGIKMATVLTGNWFEGLVSDGKGNYTYEENGLTLVVKADKTKVYF